MPNWCSNLLYISGPSEEIERFCENAVGYDTDNSADPDTGKEQPIKLVFELQSLYPMPLELLNTVESSGDNRKEINGQTWYSWRLDHWGTKWDVSNLVRRPLKSKTKATYSFNTAWWPPIEAIDTIAASYPKLRFKLKYRESGCGLKGENNW